MYRPAKWDWVQSIKKHRRYVTFKKNYEKLKDIKYLCIKPESMYKRQATKETFF